MLKKLLTYEMAKAFISWTSKTSNKKDRNVSDAADKLSFQELDQLIAAITVKDNVLKLFDCYLL